MPFARVRMAAGGAREFGAVVLIVALALALRLWNLEFGLPDWYHPDEPHKARIVAAIAGGALNPGNFFHPSFMLYAAAATLRLGHIFGAELDDQAAVRSGRLIVALLGSATVLLTFLLGRRVGGFAVAVLAATLLAVAPLHVVCSHYLKEDVPLTFWAVAAFLACMQVAARGRPRDYLLAGFVSGVAAGTKYTGLLLVGLVWLAHRERPAEASRAADMRRALVFAVLGFLLVTPFALLDFPRFVLGAGQEGGNAFTGMAGVAVWPVGQLWTFHLRNSVLPGLGLPGSLLALLGFVFTLRQPSTMARLLSTTVFAVYSVFENSPYKPPPNADRYIVLLLPFLAVLAGVALQDLYARLRGGRRWIALGITGLLGLAAIAQPLADSIRLCAAMRGDTREAARAWLMRHACGAGSILAEGALNAGGVLVPSYVPALPADCNATYVYALADLGPGVENYDFVMASSFMYDRFLKLDSAPEPARLFYAEFFARHRPVAEFPPALRSYGFHNPTIRIYRRGDVPIEASPRELDV